MNFEEKENINSRDLWIEKLGSAVKEVHLCISCPGGNKDYESCVAARLIYCLDSILLFGLHKRHKGYWPAVAQILPKSTLDFINELPTASSNLAKGRAWLLLSLNECILEGFLATLEARPSLLSKHYQHHALLRDPTCLQILITLVSGLEHVGFDFPIDVGYLNESIVDASLMAFIFENDSFQVALETGLPSTEQAAAIVDGSQHLVPETANNPEPASKLPRNPSIPKSIMNSPLVKRRSHLRSAMDGSCQSLANSKRVSFHENEKCNDALPRIQEPTKQLSRYQSEWVLPMNKAAPENMPTKGMSRSQMRRYQSEMFLSKSDNSAVRESIEMERGVPEGQEDPQRMLSTHNLSASTYLLNDETDQDDVVGDRLKRQAQSICRNNVSLTKYALSLLSLMRPATLERPKTDLNSEHRSRAVQWARQKLAKNALPQLSLPALDSYPVDWHAWNQEWQAELGAFDHKKPANDEHIARQIVQTVGLDTDECYKVFKCFIDFYSGKTRPTYLLLGSKALHVTFSQSNSLLWSATLFDIEEAIVKWDYSILLMHSIVGSFVIHFADSDTLRNCASHMDIILRRVKKASNVNSNYNEKPVVAVETPTQLKHQWERWLREHTGELRDRINYMAPVHFEESFIVSHHESVLGPSKAGHLMYRWANGRSWHAGFFIIKAGVFYQFSHQHDKVPLLIMPLDTKQCTGYGRNFHSSRPHTAEIHLSNDKCLLLAAASETEICDWLSVLSQCAMMWQDNQLAVVDHYFSPIACGIIVTEKYVVIFQADTLDHKATGKCLATVSLDNIPAIMISDDKQHNDAFCVIELDCREASEGAGDWIFYFQSQNEASRFIDATRRPYQTLESQLTNSLRNKISLLKHV